MYWHFAGNIAGEITAAGTKEGVTAALLSFKKQNKNQLTSCQWKPGYNYSSIMLAVLFSHRKYNF